MQHVHLRTTCSITRVHQYHDCCYLLSACIHLESYMILLSQYCYERSDTSVIVLCAFGFATKMCFESISRKDIICHPTTYL